MDRPLHELHWLGCATKRCCTQRTVIPASAEIWLDKPVLAINTAIYWHTLRQAGIPDKIAGFGQLLERH